MERIAALCCIIVLALAGAAHAQEPPPTYVQPTPTLFPTGGGYRLTWPAVTGAARYAIRLGITADDGTFIADDEIGNIDSSAPTFDLDAHLPHTQPNHCYITRWRVYALIGTSAPEPPGELSITMCTDAGDKSTYGNVRAAAPASPSNVRLLRAGGEWQLVWQDNSSDEAAFRPSVVIVNPNGQPVGSIKLPERSQDTTSVSVPEQLSTEAPPDSCYGAIFRVVAVGLDGTTSNPGSYATAVCNTGTRISFPDAGMGHASDHDPRDYIALTVLGAIGLLALISGWFGRRHTL